MDSRNSTICPSCSAPLVGGEFTCAKCGAVVPGNEPTVVRQSNPAADPLIGQTVGEYLIREKLGSGGMGVVYEALQPVIGKKVALKILLPEFVQNPNEVERLIAEARAANAIGHRGIVDIFGFGKLPDGRQYLAMELLRGDPLDQLIAETAPMSSEVALPILGEVADALSAAHGAGVIHRDLKPSNVFVVRPQFGSPYVKLLDFGLAKRAAMAGGSTPQTRVSMMVGTPLYMAPEQARGEAISPATDIYALGVMAFEMFAGRLPYVAPTPYEIVVMHLNSPIPRISSAVEGVPTALDDLIAKMMSKSPFDRPTSSAGVLAQLQEIRKTPFAAPKRRHDVPLPLRDAVVARTEPSGVRAPEAATASLSRQAGAPDSAARRRVARRAAVGLGIAAVVIAGGTYFGTQHSSEAVDFAEPTPIAPQSAVQSSVPPKREHEGDEMLKLGSSANVAPENRGADAPKGAPPPQPSAITSNPVPNLGPAAPKPTPQAPRRVLSKAELLRRCDALKQKLNAAVRPGEEVDHLAQSLIDKYRRDAEQAESEQLRRHLTDELDKWEARNLRRAPPHGVR